MTLKKDIVLANSIIDATYMDYETGKIFYETCLYDILPDDIIEIINDKKRIRTKEEIFEYVLKDSLIELRKSSYVMSSIARPPVPTNYLQLTKYFFLDIQGEINNLIDEKDTASIFFNCKKTYMKKKGDDLEKLLFQFIYFHYYHNDKDKKQFLIDNKLLCEFHDSQIVVLPAELKNWPGDAPDWPESLFTLHYKKNGALKIFDCQHYGYQKFTYTCNSATDFSKETFNIGIPYGPKSSCFTAHHK